jgi:hypothetical protein
MRNLLYIPMIHADPDLGSAAASVNRRSIEICGKERWFRHKEIVAEYWEKIRAHFKKMDARGLVIYQDGMMVNGELGRRIIEEGAKKGSPNHQIVLDLIIRGGVLRKTEDAELLKREFHRILQLAETRTEVNGDIGAQYRDEGKRLLAERDRFIGKTINESLRKGEKGALFIGAFHNVIAELADDIDIIEIKSYRAVKAYFETALAGDDGEAFEKLASYMVSDIPRSAGE